jgi:hypothetical protein
MTSSYFGGPLWKFELIYSGWSSSSHAVICEPKSDATPERVTIIVYIAGLAGCFTSSH